MIQLCYRPRCLVRPRRRRRLLLGTRLVGWWDTLGVSEGEALSPRYMTLLFQSSITHFCSFVRHRSRVFLY